MKAAALRVLRTLDRPLSAPTRAATAEDVATGLHTLSVLLQSGLPVTHVLRVFAEVAPPTWSPVLPEIQQRVQEGASLASALDKSAIGVARPLLSILRAGEKAGALAAAMATAADIAHRTSEFRRTLRASLSYPLLLLSSGAIATVIVVGFALPRFAVMITDLGAPVPPITRVVLACAQVANALMPFALLGLAGCSAVMLTMRRRAAGREALDRLWLSLPVIGRIRSEVAGARCCVTLAALLESGIPIVSALPYAAEATGDAVLAGRLLAARREVVAGARPSVALGQHRALPAAAIRLIKAGEETGRLSSMVGHAATLLTTGAAHRLGMLVKVLEPSLILLFGGAIAVVAASLLQAVYAIRPQGG